MNIVDEISSFTASVIRTTVVTLYGYVVRPLLDAVTNRPEIQIFDINGSIYFCDFWVPNVDLKGIIQYSHLG